ncbi:MAG TPA: hypothetical protein VFA19_02920 [Gaiellaceae bacterium]|nr:hypothetical protein [Gaiellaceae bacterium]
MTRVVLANAASLVGTFVVTSGLGMAFWLVAARHWTKATVGLSGGLMSAMALLGGICTLGLGTLLTGELPRRRSPGRTLVSTAISAGAAAGAVGGLMFAAIAPQLGRDYRPLASDWATICLFAGGVALTSAASIFDAATIGALRGRLQLWRNGFFAVAKLGVLAALALLSVHGQLSILAAWVAGIAVSLSLSWAWSHRRGTAFGQYRPRPSALRGLWRDAIGHQVYNVAYTIPALSLPVVVLSFASATANATFYIALQIAGALYVVPTALTGVLFAVGASEPDAVSGRLRLTLRLSAAVALPGIALAAAAGGPLLRAFGSAYRDGATTLLVLALAAVPLTLKTHFIALTRIQRLLANRMPLVWAGACAEVAGGAAGAAVGQAQGAALGWLLALCAEALAMSPVVRAGLAGRVRSVK